MQCLALHRIGDRRGTVLLVAIRRKRVVTIVAVRRKPRQIKFAARAQSPKGRKRTAFSTSLSLRRTWQDEVFGGTPASG